MYVELGENYRREGSKLFEKGYFGRAYRVQEAIAKAKGEEPSHYDSN